MYHCLIRTRWPISACLFIDFIRVLVQRSHSLSTETKAIPELIELIYQSDKSKRLELLV